MNIWIQLLFTLIIGLIISLINRQFNKSLQKELIEERRKIEQRRRKERLLHTLVQMKDFIWYAVDTTYSIIKSPPTAIPIILRARIELTDWLLLYPTLQSESTNQQLLKEASQLTREIKSYNKQLENVKQEILNDPRTVAPWSSNLQGKAIDTDIILKNLLKLLDGEIKKIQSELNLEN
jgi:uncharacterized membrane-anchored protein YhcB (DUF1043 family)